MPDTRRIFALSACAPCVLCGLIALASAAQRVALPLHIGGQVTQPADPASAATYHWPGTYFEARFKGTSVGMRLHDEANMLDVYVDGKLVATETRPGALDVTFGPFAEGEHRIRAELHTESQTASGEFGGFFVAGAANVLAAPAAAARAIEFIGDSYTVGYGNTSLSRQCTEEEIWSRTDTPRAFGPLTARHYGADYRLVAISGRGMVRNYNGGPGDTLPAAYPAAPAKPDWRPQIIVIGLGKNDFSTPLKPGEQWKSRNVLHFDFELSYVTFVQGLRTRNPQAFFILTATDDSDGEIQAEVKKVAATLQSQGERGVAYLPFNGLGFGACNYHPNTADDARMANMLVSYIDAHPEIWAAR